MGSVAWNCTGDSLAVDEKAKESFLARRTSSQKKKNTGTGRKRNPAKDFSM